MVKLSKIQSAMHGEDRDKYQVMVIVIRKYFQEKVSNSVVS